MPEVNAADIRRFVERKKARRREERSRLHAQAERDTTVAAFIAETCGEKLVPTPRT